MLDQQKPVYDNFNLPINNPQPKKWWLILIIVILVIVLAAGIWFFFIKKDNKKKSIQNEIKNELENKPTPGATKKISPRVGSLSLKSSDFDVKVGQEIEIQILIDTGTANIVLASAYVKYDSKLWQLVNIDSNKTVLTMSIMNKKNPGQLEIIRGIPGNANPDDTANGYTGSNGLLATLKFKALTAGSSQFTFDLEKSRLILDDGLGTEMTTNLNPLNLNIN